MDGEKEERGGIADAGAAAVEEPWPLTRVVRVVMGIASQLADHDKRCAERVQGIALHPTDHARARLHSVGTLPVLVSEDVTKGKARLVCECDVQLIPDFVGVDDFENFCEYGML